ncbi:DMT family transporter [Pyrofollis japonicus]|uniref:DMT family transporter n=1 Tax=Pyrofollis japonicus TaxID=3060460 RepID=UPI00295B045B|nr:DMT family transporter [Pyrofollis japonicus]BEP17970.1 DMT family transporter [Pyrofollis japonicus]
MNRARSLLLAFFAPLAWATNVVASRVIVVNGVDPFALTAIRWLLVAVMLAGYSFALGLGVPLGRRLLLAGLLGITLFNNLLYVALRFAPAALVGLTFALLPIVTMLLAEAMGLEKGDNILYLAAILGLLGVTLIELGSYKGSLHGGKAWLGVLIAVISVFVWALYTIESKKLMRGLHPLAALAGSTLLSTPFNIVVALPQLPGSVIRLAEPRLLVLLLYIVAVPGFLAYIAWFHAVKALGASTTSLFVNLLPVFTTILAWILLGERLRGTQLAGAILVFTALGLATIRYARITYYTPRTRGARAH